LEACSSYKKMPWPSSKSVSGTSFYEQTAAFQWKQRDSLTRDLVLKGSIPRFLQRFKPVRTQFRDSSRGKVFKAVYYVSSDYLSIGSNQNWARIHITPFLAQELADSLHCFLPTRKMVDEIYKIASIKLAPIPFTQARDSTPTFYQHYLAVEQQQKGRVGLVAGIQKDIVTTGKLYTYPKKDRVAIYGWHQLNGTPIQPLYTGHVYWYVDYSQGVRLVYEFIKVNGKWMHYSALFKDPILKNLLCDEADCGDGRYPTLTIISQPPGATRSIER
jgi:hypothetical protein